MVVNAHLLWYFTTKPLSNDTVDATRIANTDQKRQSGCEFGSPPVKGDTTSPRSAKDDATDGTMRLLSQA